MELSMIEKIQSQIEDAQQEAELLKEYAKHLEKASNSNDSEYKYDFKDKDISIFKTKKGLNEDVIGVIGVRPIHLQQERNKSNEVLSQDLWIDIGAKDRMEALSKVDIGCVATILSDIHISDGRISGKAMDNRCSLAVLVELARRLYDYQTEYDICYVATVQEEGELKQ